MLTSDSATFGIFYTFLHSLPSISVIFDLLALFLAYHFKNNKIFYIVLSFLLLRFIHLIDSIYQAHLILSLFLPITFMIMVVNDEKHIFTKTSIVNFGYLFFVLIFAFLVSNITSFNAELSSKIFKSNIIYNFFKPINELSFIFFWFFAVIILAYIFINQLSVVYFIAYFLSFIQFLFYSEKNAISYYEFGGICFVVYFMFLSYKAMFYDQLTNILNRRAYDRFHSNNYYLAIADIDHFKSFNDKYGHDVGDIVLKTFAKIMKKTCKKAKVYRLGGEEFVIVFENLNQEYVLNTLEYFRITLEKYNIKIKNEKVNISVSIGVSKNADTKDETLKLADNNLYKAKENGRNQIVWK